MGHGTKARAWLHRRRLPLGVVVSLWLAAFAFASARLFIWPATDAVRHVDAVVIFAGGRGERLALAEQLMDDNVASNLVIPNGMAPEWPAGNHACTEARPYEVHCLRPDPDTTRGEARAIARLAAEQGWATLLVVTSSYQISRAGLLLAQCFEGEVLTVGAQPDLGPMAWAGGVAHEWLAWMRAVVVQRTC